MNVCQSASLIIDFGPFWFQFLPPLFFNQILFTGEVTGLVGFISLSEVLQLGSGGVSGNKPRTILATT